MRWTSTASRGPWRRSRSVWAAGALAAGAALSALAVALGLRINWTSSMPRGLYDTGPPRFERGVLAIVCLEGEAARRARARGYVPRGDCPSGLAPIVKEIVALPGDLVIVREDGTRVCAEVGDTAWVSTDLRGRSLSRRQIGSHVLQDGEYWLLGIRRHVSWDSRYFGAVEKEQIIGSATPWLTWGAEESP